MKKLLLFALAIISYSASAQSLPGCDMGYDLCNYVGSSFPASTNGQQYGSIGCLGATPNPTWFHFKVAQTGFLSISLSERTNTGGIVDVDFICYGPFSSEATMCSSVQANPDANIADCSYSPRAIENIQIINAQAGQYYLVLVSSINNAPGNISATPTPLSAIANCSNYTLQMVSFIDSNANGIYDTNETTFPYGQFVYTNNNTGAEHNVASTNGSYTIQNLGGSQSYNISYTIPAPYNDYFTAPSGYNNVYTQVPALMETFYFPITVAQPFSDVIVESISRRSPQPGFTNTTDIVYKNLGTTPSSGSITFTIGSEQTFESLPAGAVAIGTNGFEYAYTNLQPYETRTITVSTLTGTNVAPQSVTTTAASIVPNEEESIPGNNTSTLSQIVFASYDPNDIAESHGPQINADGFNAAGDYLYYTIRFQNMGTANAQFIDIQHTLDSQIDPSTIIMLHASHNYEMDRTGNLVKWHLANIQLPPASTNEQASNGYVYFKAKANRDMIPGDMIPATAAIYFDYNSPVVTNTFQTNFIQDTSATDTVNKKVFSLYPNPAGNLVNISANDSIKEVRVYDITGKTLLQKTFNSETRIALPTDNLATGTYFIQVKTQSGTTTQKLVKN